MLRPDPKDFSVDLVARRVRHSSGAGVVFPAYEDEATWLKSDTVTIENGELFRGPEVGLAAGALRAALAAGMGYTVPKHYATLQERLSGMAGQLGFSLDRTPDGRLLVSVQELEIGRWAPADGDRLVLTLRDCTVKIAWTADEAVKITGAVIEALYEDPT
jgi:hypothetical protein